VVEVFRSIDPTKVKLASHDRLTNVLEMFEPRQFRFHFEARDTKSTKGPPTYYVLVKIERMKSDKVGGHTSEQPAICR
jgi:hypothetical protein